MKFLALFGACVLVFTCFLSVHAQQNLLEVLESLGLSSSAQALRADNLEGALASPGNYTIFAPRNFALQVQDRFLVERLNTETTTRMHVVEGRYTKPDLRNNLILMAMDGEEIRINVYTVGNDQVYTLNGVPMETFDNRASNGVVHTLQFIITPTMGSASEILNMTILGAQRFLQAAEAADMLDELDADSRTLMVPGDDVLTEDILTELLINPDELERMVRNHILPSTVLYSTGMTSDEIPTLLDNEILTFIRSGNAISVNGAIIIKADIPTSNGVIHVINAVQIPRPVDVVTVPSIG